MKTYSLAKEIDNWFRGSPTRNPTTIQLVFIIDDLQNQLESLLKNFITPFKIYVDFYVTVKSYSDMEDDEKEIRLLLLQEI